MVFKPGQSGNPKGRPRNEPNKITSELKGMIEGALQKAGGLDYLARQAEANPSAFMALVGKLLPKDVNANVNAQMDIRAWLLSLGEPPRE